MHPLCLLGAEAEGQAGAVDLDQGVANWLAGFERDEPAQLLAPLPDAGADRAEHRAALIGRQATGYLEGADGGLDRLFVLLGRRVVGHARRLVGVGRVGHLQLIG